MNLGGSYSLTPSFRSIVVWIGVPKWPISLIQYLTESSAYYYEWNNHYEKL